MPYNRPMLYASASSFPLSSGLTFSSVSFSTPLEEFPDVTLDIRYIDGHFVIGGTNQSTGESIEGGAESQFELLTELQHILEDVYGEDLGSK